MEKVKCGGYRRFLMKQCGKVGGRCFDTSMIENLATEKPGYREDADRGGANRGGKARAREGHWEMIR